MLGVMLTLSATALGASFAAARTCRGMQMSALTQQPEWTAGHHAFSKEMVA